jgi:hypothetical protein
MRLEDFRKQRRGPYLFDRWRWKERVTTKLGRLVVELSIIDDDPAPPDEKMVAVAEELASFAKQMMTCYWTWSTVTTATQSKKVGWNSGMCLPV